MSRIVRCGLIQTCNETKAAEKLEVIKKAMIFYTMLVVALFCLVIHPYTDVDLFTW